VKINPTAEAPRPRSVTITTDLIAAYAELSGDFNPIHVDLVAAAASEFGGIVAHGCIAAEPAIRSLCAWLGVRTLPSGTRMVLRYKAPCRPGDVIMSETNIARCGDDTESHDTVLDFACRNQNGVVVIAGQWHVPRGARAGSGAV